MKRSGLHLVFPVSVSIVEEDTSSYWPCQGEGASLLREAIYLHEVIWPPSCNSYECLYCRGRHQQLRALSGGSKGHHS